MAAREAFGLSAGDAARTIARLWAKVRERKVYFESYGVAPGDIGKVAPAFRHIDDVSTTELRKGLP